MSNCIMFHGDCKVRLSNREVDLGRVLHDIESATQEKDSIAWWYLQNNTTRLANGDVEIDFSRGRSSHTNRSFEATLLWLQERSNNVWFFEIVTSDEGDGYTQQERVLVTINPTKPYKYSYDSKGGLLEEGNIPWQQAKLIRKSVPA